MALIQDFMVIYPQILLFVLLYAHQSPDFLVKMLQTVASVNVQIINMEIKQEIDHVYHTVLSLHLLMDQSKQYGSLKLLNIFVLLTVKMILGVMYTEDLLVKLFQLTVLKVNMLIIVLICVFLYALNHKTILVIQAQDCVLTAVLHYSLMQLIILQI